MDNCMSTQSTPPGGIVPHSDDNNNNNNQTNTFLQLLQQLTQLTIQRQQQVDCDLSLCENSLCANKLPPPWPNIMLNLYQFLLISPNIMLTKWLIVILYLD